MTDPVPPATQAALRSWFNENRDRPRLIALMSPTCGFCLIGHQAVRTYNAWLEDEDFVTMRIWVPMMAPDSHEDAVREAATTQDPRITDLYDQQHEVARAYRDVLGLSAAAWDTYLLYQPGVTWDGRLPPDPSFAQYQLYPSWARDQSRLFTPTDFWWHLVEMVGRSQSTYDTAVPPLAAWLNDDPRARIGLEVPERYHGRSYD